MLSAMCSMLRLPLPLKCKIVYIYQNFSQALLRLRGAVRLISVMTQQKQELTRQLVALRDPMYRFARTLLQRHDEAQDAVADVTERLLVLPGQLEACRDLRAFVLTAVRNRCCDLLRRRQTQLQREAPLSDRTAPAAEGAAERWEVRELVRQAMAELPQQQREVLHLKEIEGFSTQELAAMYATGEAQIRVWLSRARIRMRATIEKWMNDGKK